VKIDEVRFSESWHWTDSTAVPTEPMTEPKTASPVPARAACCVEPLPKTRRPLSSEPWSFPAVLVRFAKTLTVAVVAESPSVQKLSGGRATRFPSLVTSTSDEKAPLSTVGGRPPCAASQPRLSSVRARRSRMAH
jgi:hypothetical protein